MEGIKILNGRYGDGRLMGRSLVSLRSGFEKAGESGLLLPVGVDLSPRYGRAEVLEVSSCSFLRVGDVVLYDKANLVESLYEYEGGRGCFLDDVLVLMVESRVGEF